MDKLITLAIEAPPAVLFVYVALRAWRTRDPLMRDVALLLSSLAVIFVADVLERLLGTTTPLAALVAVLFLAMPVFALKLVADLRTVPYWLVPGVAFALVASVAFAAVGARIAPGIAAAPFGLVFVGGLGLAAGYLLVEARHRHGAPRARLALAALATISLLGEIFALLGGQVANASVGAGIAAEGAALVTVIFYWIAFVPPAPLRRMWQANEAMPFTQELMLVPAGEAVEGIWSRYLATAGAITGGQCFIILAAADGTSHLADQPATMYPAGAFRRLRDSIGAIGSQMVDGPIRLDLAARTHGHFCSGVEVAPGVLLVVVTEHARLFGEDDLDLLAGLGAQAAMLVERRALLADQVALNEQLAVTVRALEAAGAAKSDFLASMSHELRTPLNAIIGFSDLMRGEPIVEEQVHVPLEWVDHVHHAGQHLLGLINDVLDLAKVEAGRLELAREPVDLGQLVAETVAGLRPLAERRNLHLEGAAATATIEADRGRLRQVLYNLLSNALKFTPAGGRVTVEARLDGATAYLVVTDTGVGIALDDQARVFEEFQQVGAVESRQGGTGLGLALTRRLVEAHGGHIELLSAPGEGSRFTVVLPAGAAITAPAIAGPAPTASMAAGRDVLVIEDDPSAVRLLRRYLEDGGYGMRVAADGTAGLAAARAVLPAAILLDVLLPGLDGWEVLRALKADEVLRGVPVIMVTVVDEREVGLALGAVDYLLKPVEREALLAVLARHALAHAVPGRAVRVLAIDDEGPALDLVAAALEPAGFEVRRAASGQAALDLAAREAFDLVVCDLVMPGVDGFAVVAGLKGDARTRDLPILILTAHELTAADKERLNGRILGIVDKGPTGAEGLREWLARAVPAAADARGVRAA